MNGRGRIHRELSIEELETRAAPALFLVTSAADAGAGSLRQAILDANAAAGADAIQFDGNLDGQTITLTSGELAITDALTITGPGADRLAVDADGHSRVFNVDDGAGPQIAVAISGLTLTNGRAAEGGAIYNREGLTLDALTISGSSATSHGGGIYNYLGFVTVWNSTIFSNEAGGSGGGVFSYFGATFITNSTISANRAGTTGGGIYEESGGCFRADTRVLMADGSHKRIADIEPGDEIVGYDFTADKRVTNVVDRVYVHDSKGYLLINGLEVTESHPFAVGPDQWVKAGELKVGDRVIGNSYTEITRIERVPQPTKVYNLEAANTHNFYVTDGENIFLVHNKTLFLRNSTVTDNTATVGGGVYIAGFSPLVTSSIVAGNTGLSSAPDVSGWVISSGYNLVGDGTGSSGWLATDLVGTSGSPIDPLLGPLGNNGGPTHTHALLLGSPAIDSGANPLSLTTDQRGPGFPRVVGASADIGAYESGYLAPIWQWASPNGNVMVSLFDVYGPVDIDPNAVTVQFGANDTVTSISFTGINPMEGLGLTVHGATAVGPVTDLRYGPLGDVAFIASDSPVQNISLHSSPYGYNLNGMEVGGILFAADIDGDYDTYDPTGVYARGDVSNLWLYAGSHSDVVIDNGNLGFFLAFDDVMGDVDIGGSLNFFYLSANLMGMLRVEGGDAHAIYILENIIGGEQEQPGFGGDQFFVQVNNFNGYANGGIDVYGDLDRLFILGQLDGVVYVGGGTESIYALGGIGYVGYISIGDGLDYLFSGAPTMGAIDIWSGNADYMTFFGEVSGYVTVWSGDVTQLLVIGPSGTALNYATIDVRHGSIDTLVLLGSVENSLLAAGMNMKTTLIAGNLTDSSMEAGTFSKITVHGLISAPGQYGDKIRAQHGSFIVTDLTQSAEVTFGNPATFGPIGSELIALVAGII